MIRNFPGIATNRKLISENKIEKKIEQMHESLQGFWQLDSWDIRECPHPSAIELSKFPSVRIRWVRFGKIENVWLKTEIKYFFFTFLQKGVWSAKSVWIRKGTVINKMLLFLNLKYPKIKSISDIPIEKAINEYRVYLKSEGIKTTSKNHKLDKKQNKVVTISNSYYITMLKQLMEFYEDFYFDGEEWDKDVWNVDNLNVSEDKINPTAYEYTINFKGFKSEYFKEQVKKYTRLMLNTLSFSHVSENAAKLKVFFNFLEESSPHIKRIHQITRDDIEKYINFVNSKKYKPSTVTSKISTIEVFLLNIQRFDWKDAPSKILIFKEDYPRVPKATPRYIDDHILLQLNSKLDKLEPYMATMVMIIQECGMRISELCTLKRGCVITDQEGDNFIKYYQWKMKKEHIVPISRETAELILIQEKRIIAEISEDCVNLFPRKDGTPLKQETFRKNLNQLSYDENIIDVKGKVFRFHSHAFRHTVRTKMINNGVPQHIVQKFLGHESPEMTSRYAHIFDETLKKEFMKFKETLIMNNGDIINLSSEDTEANNLELQWFKKNINAQALPNGYCRLPVIAGPCPHANACLDCTNFCTSKKFINEHEEHLKRTNDILSKAQKNQWQRQIETNERVKNRLEQIIHSLKETSINEQ